MPEMSVILRGILKVTSTPLFGKASTMASSHFEVAGELSVE